jgi:hypothetical protein
MKEDPVSKMALQILPYEAIYAKQFHRRYDIQHGEYQIITSCAL